MANQDDMSIYDGAALAGATLGAATFSGVLTRMAFEQRMFNTSNGKKGFNWQGDAKALDKKIAGLPKKSAEAIKSAVKNGFSAALTKDPYLTAGKYALSAVTNKSKKAKDKFIRDVAKDFIPEEKILELRARVQTLDEFKDADQIKDLKAQVQDSRMRNKIAGFVAEYDSNESKLGDLKKNKSTTKEVRNLTLVNKNLNNKINNFIKDPAIAQSIEDDIQNEAMNRKAGKVKKVKHKLPKKTLALLAAGGGINMLLGKGINKIGDEAHDIADAFKNPVTNDVNAGSVLGDTVGTVADFVSYAPGALSGTAIAGTVGNYGLNKLKDKYNVYDDPDGMGKLESLKQAASDTGGAVKDKVSKFGTKIGQAGKYVTTKGMFASENDKRLRRKKAEAQQKYYDDREKKRWTDPNIEKYETARQKDINRQTAEANIAKTDADITARVEAARNTGFRQHVSNSLNSEIDQYKYEIIQNNQKLNDFDTDVYHGDKSSGAYTTIENKIKTAKEAIKNRVGYKSELNNMHTDADIKSNPLFRGYAEGAGNKAKIAEAVTKKAVERATGAVQDTKPIIDDTIETGKEKTKGFLNKNKERLKNVFGKSEMPPPGTNMDDLVTKPNPKPKGIVSRTARNIGGKLSSAAAIPQIGEASWGLAQMGHDLYDAPDKRQYLEDTGESIYEGIKELPEELMRTGSDYKAMWDQGEYLPMAGKALTDYAVPSVKAFGNIAMGLGEQTGLYDAPGYWDMDKKGFYTLDDTEDSAYKDFHASDMTPEQSELINYDPKAN